MYIGYEDYVALGYDTVPQRVFERYLARADACVRRYTQDRIATMGNDEIGELNKRGVCEMVELY